MIISHRSAAIGKFLMHRANPHAGKPVMKHGLYLAVIIAALFLLFAFNCLVATLSYPEIVSTIGLIIAIVLLPLCLDACVMFFFLSLGHTVQLAEEKRYHTPKNSAWQFVAKEDL